MKIAEVSLSKMLGLREFEFRPGQLTLIKGANRAGKSTVARTVLMLKRLKPDASPLRPVTPNVRRAHLPYTGMQVGNVEDACAHERMRL